MHVSMSLFAVIVVIYSRTLYRVNNLYLTEISWHISPVCHAETSAVFYIYMASNWCYAARRYNITAVNTVV
jgi:hypothetical protein